MFCWCYEKINPGKKYKNGERDWFNKISENLYLGAIPLKSCSTTGHQGRLDTIPTKMVDELGVKGVVSINEEFERVVRVLDFL